MGVKVAFTGEANPNCYGKGPEYTGLFLKSKEHFWNEFKKETGVNVYLSEVLKDLGYDSDVLEKILPVEEFGSLNEFYWNGNDLKDIIDFGITFNEDGSFLLNFNCGGSSQVDIKKKRCYFWKVYKYHVDISEITLRGWVDWCNELYQIQHGKPRPKSNRIFISPDMTVATVKGRFWNKDRIEKWLTDHGYSWTQSIETKYQFPVSDKDEIELVDSDAELKARRSA